MTIKNCIKWLLIRKGSKIVVLDSRFNNIETVRQKLKMYHGVTTDEWNGRLIYKMKHIRFATKKEIKAGKRL